MNKITKTTLALMMPLLFSGISATHAAQSVPENVSSASSEQCKITFFVARHGKTMFNTVHRAQGWSDTPLTPAGIEVAEHLGKGLNDISFSSVYSSDLGRARQTARIILATKGQSLEIHEDERLRETGFGIYEGDLDPNMWNPAAKKLGYDSFETLIDAWSKGEVKLDTMMDTIASSDTIGMAENSTQVRTRMHSALDSMTKESCAQGGGNVLVVSHGMAIITLLGDMTAQENLREPLKNASVTLINYQDGQYKVGNIGDMSYVEKGSAVK